MLSGFTKRFRRKAALTLALLYGFCILAPHAAMALTNNAAHCLDDHVAAHVHNDPAAQQPHLHADGSAHQGAPHQHSGGDKKSHSGSCCGLFCVTAIAQEPGLALAAPPPAVATTPSLDYILAGRGPGRINRPPIA